MAELSGIDSPRMNGLTADLPIELQCFKHYYELTFSEPFADKDEGTRDTYILLWIRQDGLNIFNSWELSNENSKKVDVIWSNFKTHVEPTSNFRLSRFNLHKYRQTATKSVDEFMMKCKTQAKKCRFHDDSMMIP